jgi:hypothetical protein
VHAERKQERAITEMESMPKGGERLEERHWKKRERPVLGVENSCTAYCFLTNQLKCFMKVLNPFSKYSIFLGGWGKAGEEVLLSSEKHMM